jgi:hypothetical protein
MGHRGYIRALQLSQDANSADVPAGQKVPSGRSSFRNWVRVRRCPWSTKPAAESRNESGSHPSRLDGTSVVKTIQQRSLLVGLGFGVLAAVGLWARPDQFFRAYLIGFMAWLGVTLGSMAILMLRH